MDVLYECAACHLPLDRERVHYGGMSCYSCRAFFRRKTQKNDLARCQLKQECKISYIERKSCPPCRYEKCLRAGMRADLVLNDDEKRKRFQKYLRQTIEESDKSDEENDFEVEFVKTSRKRIIPDQQKEKRGKLDTKSRKIKSKPAPNYKPRTYSFEMDSASDKEPDYETDDPWEIPIPDDVEESRSESTEECLLDPETGLLVDPSKKEKEMIYNGMEVQTSGLTLPIDKAKSSFFPVYKYTSDATFPTSTQVVVDSSNSLPTMRKKIIHTDETQILNYVDKKIGVAPGKNVSPFVDCGETSGSNEELLNTFLHHHNDIYQHHHEHLHEHPHEHLHEHTPCQPRQA